jgi:hypothetical protein
MIVSSTEIARVLDLARRSLLPQEAILACDHSPMGYPAEAPGLGRNRVHLQDVQQRLAAGAYDVPPDLLAEKMIGRAICDQTSKLCDKRLHASGRRASSPR